MDEKTRQAIEAIDKDSANEWRRWRRRLVRTALSPEYFANVRIDATHRTARAGDITDRKPLLKKYPDSPENIERMINKRLDEIYGKPVKYNWQALPPKEFLEYCRQKKRATRAVIARSK